MNRYIYHSITLLLLLCSNIYGQKNVTGIVTDSIGNPLSNINISVISTGNKTISSENGSYTIKVPSYRDVLKFKAPGYKDREVEISSPNVDVLLYEDVLESILELSLEELSQITITAAGKKEEKISDIPASVEIINRSDIEAYGYSSLEDIICNITGYYSLDDLSYTNSLPGVRGYMSQNGTGVIILINGVSQLRKGLESFSLSESNVPVECIDKIEIIRGPMSVMYGTGAFFGVINIITNKPKQGLLNGHVAATAGSLKTKKINAGFVGSEGVIDYSMNMGYSYTYGRNFSLSEMTDNLNKFETQGASSDTDGRLEGWNKYFDVSINVKSLLFKVTYFEMMQENYGVVASWGDDGDHSENSRMNVMLGYDKDINTKLNFNASFRYNILNEYYDVNWFNDDYYARQDLRGTSYEAEIRANYTPTKDIDVTLGLTQNTLLNYFMIWDYTMFGGFYNNHDRYLDHDNNIISSAGFLQANYSPISNLKILGGFRIEKMSDYNFSQSYGSDTTGTNSDAVREKLKGRYKSDGAAFIPRAAIMYNINKTNQIKLFYSQGIRHPGFDENSQNIKDIDRFGNLQDEKISTYEFAYSTTISSVLNISTSLFHNKLENLITRVWQTDLNGDIISHQENAGIYVTNGLEMSFLYTPSNKIHIKLCGSYQNSIDNRKGFKNIKVAYSPNLLAYASILYKLDKYSISLSYNYIDAMETFWDGGAPGSINEGKRIGAGSDAYFLLASNMRANNLFGTNIYANLKISNLLNTHYTIPASNLNNWAEKGNPGYLRMFLFSLGYKF